MPLFNLHQHRDTQPSLSLPSPIQASSLHWDKEEHKGKEGTGSEGSEKGQKVKALSVFNQEETNANGLVKHLDNFTALHFYCHGSRLHFLSECLRTDAYFDWFYNQDEH
ncbi:hypothetical protein E2C01_095077 [Portunus trituberculatus]|uniref:Uncharacterized protein n=1 Tax=Portunus trituberculatus TaxID=210409 RepID=A0A5B7JS78_PORTR|nr:hypothetical protein [Portunus trituberculatus]